MLELLKLERERPGTQAELGPVEGDDRSDPDVVPDCPFDFGDRTGGEAVECGGQVSRGR